MDEFLDISTSEGRKRFQERREKGKEMLPEIEEMREPIKEILAQLRPHLEQGEYQLLISDEASARIPSLIFLEIINRLYREKGLSPIRFLPLAPTMLKGEDEETEILNTQKQGEIVGIIKEVVSTLPKTEVPLKPLIVTQTVWKGRALHTIGWALKTAGVLQKADAVTIGITPQGKKEKDFLEKISVDHLFVGAEDIGLEGTPSISNQPELSGVEQEYPPLSPFAKPVRKHPRETETRNPQRAREDARKLAGELYEWYKKV